MNTMMPLIIGYATPILLTLRLLWFFAKKVHAQVSKKTSKPLYLSYRLEETLNKDKERFKKMIGCPGYNWFTDRHIIRKTETTAYVKCLDGKERHFTTMILNSYTG